MTQPLFHQTNCRIKQTYPIEPDMSNWNDFTCAAMHQFYRVRGNVEMCRKIEQRVKELPLFMRERIKKLRYWEPMGK